jgi:RimJ/RimL family protein N-acetyltransferase
MVLGNVTVKSIEETGMDEIVIRRFEPGDKKKVMDFFDQMGDETRTFFTQWNRNTAMSFFDGDQPDKVFFLAEENNVMVGYTFLWETNRGIPWLGIAVHEAYKGKGLGKRLIQTCIDWALKNGKGGIILSAHPANIRAHALYERMGFEQIGTNSSAEALFLFRF